MAEGLSLVKIDSDTFSRPRLLAAGPLATLLHLAAECYAARLLTDGFIPAAEVERLVNWSGVRMHRPDLGGAEGTAGAVYAPVDPFILALGLCAEGVWRRIGDDGFAIVGYLLDNPNRHEVQREQAARAAQRERRQARLRADFSEKQSGENVTVFASSRPSSDDDIDDAPYIASSATNDSDWGADLTPPRAANENRRGAAQATGGHLVTSSDDGVPAPGHPDSHTHPFTPVPEPEREARRQLSAGAIGATERGGDGGEAKAAAYSPVIPEPGLSNPVHLGPTPQPPSHARGELSAAEIEAQRLASLTPDDPSLAPAVPKTDTRPNSRSRFDNGGQMVKAFLDEVERLRPGTKVLMNPRNAKAVKECGVEPEFLAEAYLAARLGKWGDRWLRENMSVWAVADRIDGYRAFIESLEGSAAESAVERQHGRR